MSDLTGQIIKGYHLHECIGEGGFGAVYRAFQPVIEREVAVKVILPQYANQTEFIRRFETEAQLVARLEHPHIVPLYDYWREPDSAYLVMRYVRAGSLRGAISQKALDDHQVLWIVEQIAAALAIAHRNGVVHQDIKPENILLDDDSNAYLTDFGIAKVIGEKRGEEEGVSGSPAYFSPEQIRSQEVSPLADIYALGMVLYELVMHEHPYRGLTPHEMITKHLQEPLPDIRSLRPELPAALNNVIQKATAKDPTQRYSDTVALTLELRQSLMGGTSVPSVSDIDLTPIVNPYKGLRAFEEADALDFFGREALTERLLGRLHEPGEYKRFLAVVGPSGSGKSSVVKAGLLPAIRDEAIAGSNRWFLVDMVPGSTPLRNLETVLRSIAAKPPNRLLEQLQADTHGLVWAVDRVLSDVDGDLVLVIDQFEELFTLVDDERERTHFLDLLHTTITDPDSRLWVIVTLRADFTDRPLQYTAFGELMRQRTEFVLPLSASEIEQAIVGPASRAGLRVEPELVAAVIADVKSEPGALPLLEYALTEVFERRNGRRLTLAAYQAIGRLAGALAKRAEEVYNALDTVQQSTARQAFLRLVTLGEGTEDTRRRILRSELVSVISDTSMVQKVLDAFGQFRLLTFDQDTLTREPTVEVAHEALLREWGRLQEWLDTSRADVRLQRLLTNASAEWQRMKQDASYLLTGARLSQYEEWVNVTDLALTGAEQAYLNASIQEHERREMLEQERRSREAELEKQARNRLRVLAAALLVFLVIAVGLTVFAFNERGEAASQAVIAKRNAEESRSLALAIGAQQALTDGQPDEAVSLAMEANNIDQPPSEAQRALADAADNSWIRDRFFGHQGTVWIVAYSPDGKTALSGASDATLILWDVATGGIIRRFEGGHDTDIYGVAFSRDGKLALSGAAGGLAVLWDVATGEIVRRFEGHTGDIIGVKFSPDGIHALTTSVDKSLILWDVATGEIVRRFEGHTADVWSAVFSSDGQFVLSGAGDMTLILWNVESGEIVRQFENGHTDVISSVALSHDGKTALSGSWDTTLVLWDIATGDIIRRLQGHQSLVWAVAFSPDGRTILSGADDTYLILWDVATGNILRRSAGHQNGVFSLAFSPDGTTALTTSDDTTPVLWDLTSNTLIRRFQQHTFDVASVAFSADGTRALSGSHDSTMKLWDVESGEVLRTYEGHTSHVSTVAFRPGDLQALTGSDDNTLKLWDIESGTVLRTYEGHSNHVTGIAFSADGNTFLSASEDGTLKLWDAESGAVLRTFEGHKGSVRSVALSPDGKTVLSGSDDNTLILWDLSSGEQVHVLKGHIAPVLSVAFSPDGEMALSGSRDATIQLWDLATGQTIRSFNGHTSDVSTAIFSPDGQWVLSGSRDATILLWDVNTGTLLRRFQGHLSQVFSLAFSPDGRTALSGSDDSTMILWKIEPYEGGVLAWTQKNRYVPELTCIQRSFYRIEPECDEAGIFPTRTPFPVAST